MTMRRTEAKRRKREIEAEALAPWRDGGPDDDGWSEDDVAERERDSRRLVNTAQRFWHACPQAKCRRHRRCAHDPDFCGPIFWPVVPEEIKAWWRALHQAKAAGRSCRRALCEAGEAMAFERRKQASYKAVPKVEPGAPPR